MAHAQVTDIVLKWVFPGGGFVVALFALKKAYDENQQKKGDESRWREQMNEHRQDCVTDRTHLNHEVSVLQERTKDL